VSDVVLVTGPRLAGVTGVLERLRRRMPGRSFVEAGGLDAGAAPAAVVFVVSAVAPITESDCAIAVLAAAQTDAVVAVVSKIDDHRGWREVLAANRDRLAGSAERFRDVVWVGAAAAPLLGDPIMDELVATLERMLADPDLRRRNSLRAWESRVQADIARLEGEAAAERRRARVDLLRDRRAQLESHRRRSRSERAVALRGRIQQARVALTYSARNRCAAARAELLEEVAATTRRGLGDVEQRVRRRCRDIVAETDEEITAHASAIAAELGLPQPQVPPAPTADLPDPPERSRRLETQLMTVLGVGFGLGVALVVARLLSGLAAEPTVGGPAAGAIAGMAVTVWVVRVRGLLHDRAVLDRWVGEATAAVRSMAEEQVVTRMVAAEAALMSAHAAPVDTRGPTVGQRIAEIDAELREHERALDRAEAERDRAMPSLQRALEDVRAALRRADTTESVVTGR